MKKKKLCILKSDILNKTNTAFKVDVKMEFILIKSIDNLLWGQSKCEPENNIISQYACMYLVLCLIRLSKHSKSAINMGFKNEVT